MFKKISMPIIAVLCAAQVLTSTGCKKEWDVLSEPEKMTLNSILAHWETWVPQKKEEGTAPLITFEELFNGLNETQIAFLKRVTSIDPRKSFDFQGNYLGNPADDVSFKKMDDQVITKQGKQEKINPQYLPQNVFSAYDGMMKAMEADLGKRLLVESGYRSPAYQLYTFLFYLPKHGYSLVETGHWIALPGYSEHGAPHKQAIDFINQQGVNGEDRPEDFEELDEYDWLMKNAGKYGFKLSYPRDQKGITFEPWHWRYESDQPLKS